MQEATATPGLIGSILSSQVTQNERALQRFVCLVPFLSIFGSIQQAMDVMALRYGEINMEYNSVLINWEHI